MPDGLAGRVLSWALAMGLEAAARALINSRWLADREFVAQCVVGLRGEPPAAMVDCSAAAKFLARRGRDDDPEAMAVLREAIDLAASAQGRRLRALGEASW